MPKRFRSIGRWSTLAVCAAACAATADAACTITQIAEIKVRMDGRSPLIDGQINGQDVRMLADTGAERTAIVGSTAERLGLKQRFADGVTFFGAGGKSQATIVVVDRLKLGDFVSSRPLTVFVIGRDAPVGANDPPVLVGADFFGQADLEVDLANNVIRMMRPKDCQEGDVVYWDKPYSVEKLKPSSNYGVSGTYVVDVSVNGKRMEALLDTGAWSSVLSLEGARKAGIEISAGDDEERAGGIGKRLLEVSSGVMDSFAFDQEAIRNSRIRIADVFGGTKVASTSSRIPRSVGDFPDMLLGADFFLAHRVFIAKSEGRVYITYNGGPVFDDPGASASKAGGDADR